MRPALSVLLLTTLIGAGQGLFIAIAGTETLQVLRAEPAQSLGALPVAGSVVSLLLCALGLVASFFHLGHPERAWRTATCWRTSWLSREVIVLPLLMAVIALYGASHWLVPGDSQMGLGLLGIVLSLALYLCTGMIYAVVKAIREWATPITVINFTLMGIASGFTLAAALAAISAPALTSGFAIWAAWLTLIAALGRFSALRRNTRIVPATTPQSAIGVRHPRVVQRSQGAMGGSFNTREFFHGKSPEFALAMARAFPVVAFLIPLILLLAVYSSTTGLGALAAWLAFAVQFAGLLIERWVFFAQANHTQNLYYRTVG
ncbi:MAG: dimethyl sulfoxide reductase anchor subunit family protein [Quisquiliibacterium sp.]